MGAEAENQARPGDPAYRMEILADGVSGLTSDVSSPSATNGQHDAKHKDAAEVSSQVFTYHNGNQLVMLKSMATIDLGQATNRSTTGFISSKLVVGVRMTAISGWVGPKNRSRSVLYNPLYTQLVRDVAGLLDFHLPPDRWDSGYKKPLEEHKGRFNACHIVCLGQTRCDVGTC